MLEIAGWAANESALFIWRARSWMGGQITLRAPRPGRPESSGCLTGQRNSKRSGSIVRRRLQTTLSDRGLSPRMIASARSHDDAWNIRVSNTRWSKRSTRPDGNGRSSETVGHPERELPSIERRLSAQLNERSAARSEISDANRSAEFAAPASV